MEKELESLLDKLSNLKQPSSSSSVKLDEQIGFMENMNNNFIKTPITISILNSLKELKGIKQKQLDNLKSYENKKL